MSYYSKHVFFCTNDREDGSPCCQRFDTRAMRKYVKNKCKELGLHGKEQVRVSSAGCLGRCQEGPVIVIYPEAVWYTYIDEDDVDEIIDSHLVNGIPVDRLRISG